MRLQQLFTKIILIISLSVWLSACGGGGGGESVANDNLCGTVVDIGPSSIVEGVLEAGDCRLTDLDPTSGDTSFADEYRVTLNSMGTLIITMRSADLDSFLILLNRSSSCSSGCTVAEAGVITFDDDSGGGVNGLDALISMDLEAGAYIIVVNSIDPGTGGYTLETSI
jgi:hypothetical protein